MTGTAERPYCFYDQGMKKNYPIPAIKYYTSNHKAWVNGTTYQYWKSKIFEVEMSKRYPGEKHILILDNCSSHQEGGMSSTIEIFLPPKTTSRKQPFDMGVGYSFKQLYKYGLLNAVAKFEQVGVDGLFAPAKLRDDPGHGRRGLEDGHPPHVLDA